MQTSFGPNAHLHEYSGHSGDVWTDGAGNATIGIPPNDNGLGYVCYSRAGLDRPNRVVPAATIQLFAGAADLDTGPALAGQTTRVGRIWCDAAVPVALRPESVSRDLTFSLVGPRQVHVALHQGAGRTSARGWHTSLVSSSAASDNPFKLAVTYTATRVL